MSINYLSLSLSHTHSHDTHTLTHTHTHTYTHTHIHRHTHTHTQTILYLFTLQTVLSTWPEDGPPSARIWKKSWFFAPSSTACSVVALGIQRPWQTAALYLEETTIGNGRYKPPIHVHVHVQMSACTYKCIGAFSDWLIFIILMQYYYTLATDSYIEEIRRTYTSRLWTTLSPARCVTVPRLYS